MDRKEERRRRRPPLTPPPRPRRSGRAAQREGEERVAPTDPAEAPQGGPCSGERGGLMGPAEVPQIQWAGPIPSSPRVYGRKLWRSVSKVLGNDNLLAEILVRLSSKPSSLPRASAVCKRWRNILSDPEFLKRFRKHHRKPPLLGFFEGYANRFTPVMDSPDRITAACFSMPKRNTPYNDHREYMGCRHGLAVLVNKQERKTFVWDPLTGRQHSVAFPPGLDDAFTGNFCMWRGAVLCADAEDGHVHGDCFSSPFKLVLVCCGGYNTQAFCSVYDSVSGVWGGVFSTAISSIISMLRPSILVGNTICWLISGGDILVFDFECQSLHVIEKPAYYYVTDGCFQLLRMEGGGLGLAVLLGLTIQLWERKSNCDGVVGWVLLQKTIPLEGMFPKMDSVRFVGYDEDTNVIVLTSMTGNFTLQLDSMQIKHIVKRNNICYDPFYPYTNFYTTGKATWREGMDLELIVIGPDLLTCYLGRII
ncbi:uncharacterized protein LOC123406194 isoform X3 [Hordeum vulgare subsp. vulgare]|uniref:uncharacterized protein LOC123406194 isoform X3 n=1 Tax=Hordeum vulgare subsp. vulgare TaxID=112509 RepID=UPI0002947FA0|nr:uncharacterized protein LOC123406194 isoform X3 [Hordeum vulgare subsp. vulgare]